MIPPLVRGATMQPSTTVSEPGLQFPMIPPLVRGATRNSSSSLDGVKALSRFPMIPPLVRGATLVSFLNTHYGVKFPMIPPLVRGATSERRQSKQ